MVLGNGNNRLTLRVTDNLTQNQRITALGNGVLPLQAAAALSTVW